MLFSSYPFIFIFLPAFLLFWQLAASSSYARHGTVAVFLGFSIIFYALWGLPFLFLLLAMICINYYFGCLLAHQDTPVPESQKKTSSRKTIFVLALLLNLAPLLWFKYSWFIIRNLALLFDADWEFTPPGLPLGISFYTFIQIAWLTGIYRRQFTPPDLPAHALFSCAFPYVISGPIVRYEQTGWQMENMRAFTAEDLARGITLFCMGLAKKILLADSCGLYADAVFRASALGWPLSSAESWLGSFFYTFQLYFDFSGYTDMAIGIGLMVGLKLPENFNSPYKSTGIIDFWHRWHITLSSWLRDFLYIPLGGNRRGKPRQYFNLFTTMLIGGAWHGAGWTYILWGAMHGLMLGVNHFFRASIKNSRVADFLERLPLRLASIAITFLCLNFCWVIFRAPDLNSAIAMYRAMFLAPFLSDQTLPDLLAKGDMLQQILPNQYLNGWQPFALLGACAIISWCLPNSGQIMHGTTNSKIFHSWHPGKTWAIIMAVFTFAALAIMGRQTTFLYFQF